MAIPINTSYTYTGGPFDAKMRFSTLLDAQESPHLYVGAIFSVFEDSDNNGFYIISAKANNINTCNKIANLDAVLPNYYTKEYIDKRFNDIANGDLDLTEYAKIADLTAGNITVKSSENAITAEKDTSGNTIASTYASKNYIETTLKNNYYTQTEINSKFVTEETVRDIVNSMIVNEIVDEVGF